jgi:hypothetical protein
MTDAGVVLERCVAMAMRHGHATEAGVWLRGPSKLYEPHNSSFMQSHSVDENDPTLVAMRARRVVADIHALGSALPGVLAFPMIVRGEPIGALICGNKEHAEAYAPDEIQSLRNMAAAVGHALDSWNVLSSATRDAPEARSSLLSPTGPWQQFERCWLAINTNAREPTTRCPLRAASGPRTTRRAASSLKFRPSRCPETCRNRANHR